MADYGFFPTFSSNVLPLLTTTVLCFLGYLCIQNSVAGLRCLNELCASLSAKGEKCEFSWQCEGALGCDSESERCTELTPPRATSSPTDEPIFVASNDGDNGGVVNVGAIVGGVVGGASALALLALLFCGFCLWSRRRAAAKEKGVSTSGNDKEATPEVAFTVPGGAVQPAANNENWVGVMELR